MRVAASRVLPVAYGGMPSREVAERVGRICWCQLRERGVPDTWREVELDASLAGKPEPMIEIVLIVLLVLLLTGAIGYRGRRRRL